MAAFASPIQNAFVNYAAVDTDGDARHLSYRVLDRAITALSAELAGRGLRRGARIALLGINSAEYLIASIAI